MSKAVWKQGILDNCWPMLGFGEQGEVVKDHWEVHKPKKIAKVLYSVDERCEYLIEHLRKSGRVFLIAYAHVLDIGWPDHLVLYLCPMEKSPDLASAQRRDP